MTQARVAHVPAIDWLKGLAIVAVICIHAKTYETTFVYLHVINRAVPIFLVLFGVTSNTFWESRGSISLREKLREWYGRRLARLVVPIWLMAGCWWFTVMSLGLADTLRVGWGEAILTFLGYSPWIGPTWFITLLAQLVLCFPAIRWVAIRLRPVAALSIAALICVWSARHVWDVVEFGRRHVSTNVYPPGFFYYWIFTPRVLWYVVAGIFIARFMQSRPGLTATLVACAVWGCGVTLLVELPVMNEELFVGPVDHQALENLLDVPLTIALLGLLVRLEPLRGKLVLRFAEFCGRASWGIYIGHVLVFEIVHLLGHAPETGAEALRVAFAVSLLLVSVGLVVTLGRMRGTLVRRWQYGLLGRSAL